MKTTKHFTRTDAINEAKRIYGAAFKDHVTLEQSATAVSGQAVAPAETGQVFPTRVAAIQEGERIGGCYTVEPINGAGGLGQHRLII